MAGATRPSSRVSRPRSSAAFPRQTDGTHAGQAGQAPWALKWNDRSSLGRVDLTSRGPTCGPGQVQKEACVAQAFILEGGKWNEQAVQ